MPQQKFDPLLITQELIRCPSITPLEAGTLDLIEKYLKELGFTCYRQKFSEAETDDVENLYARYGESAPNLCFAGHTDVVPVGDLTQWTFDPFEAKIDKHHLYGRGAVDMKGAIACFISAVKHYLDEHKCPGSLSLLITCDEEGPSINGTKKLLEWVESQGEKIDYCLVGEPSNPEHIGDMIKVGRRGSLTGEVIVEGTQGHIAYPHLADNPCHKLVTLLEHLKNIELDKGNQHFQPSSLQIFTIDVNNPTTNIIPAKASAKFNIRFNTHYTGNTLEAHLREILDNIANQYDIKYKMNIRVSGEAFLTENTELIDYLSQAIDKHTSSKAELSTSGGTSDARFIHKHCPVVEFGLVSQTMHKVDEYVRTEDIYTLTHIYQSFITCLFEQYK